MGTALLVAASISGDGLRLLEGLLGLAMLLVGLQKAKHYNEQALSAVGIGIVGILGNMTLQQITMAKAVIKSLGLGTIEAQATTETPALTSKPETAPIEKGPAPEGPALIP
jgi:hypothetical protein